MLSRNIRRPNESKLKLKLCHQHFIKPFSFSLLEKGKQILMKDNLIDEEKAKEEEAAQETIEQKLERIGNINLKKTDPNLL